VRSLQAAFTFARTPEELFGQDQVPSC
jgi:hypothetical protein